MAQIINMQYNLFKDGKDSEWQFQCTSLKIRF